MRIATRLRLAGLFSLVVFAAVGAALFSTTLEVRRELTRNEAAGEILSAVNAVRYLTLEYVLRHEERAQTQWQLRHASLSKLLAGVTDFAGSEEQTVIDELQHAHEGVSALFIQLVANHRDRSIDKKRSAVLEELETRLTGQIMNKTQAMISDALALSQLSRGGVLHAQQRATAAVVAFGSLVVCVFVATFLLLLRSVIRPLAKLGKGAVIVGAGNLDFRLGIGSRDEIGDVARAFDRMTEALKGTTVSRDELVKTNDALQAEVTVRQQAERRVQAQLGRLNLLHQITRAIGERQDLRSIFQVAVRTIEDNLPIDFGCVCIHDRAGNTLKVIQVGIKGNGLSEEFAAPQQASIAIDQNGLSRCMQGRLVYEPDISHAPFPFPRRLARGGMRSLVLAPLLVESEVFGVLVAARVEAQSFSSGECEFLRQLSEHVALAAHQAQLHEALQQAYDDLRRTQQVVIQQERLRSLGQMASGIAHDINNAISPVALYTESLLETETGMSERARGYLETIQRAIDDVAKTVARMREFSRHREPQLTLAAVDLNRLAQQVVDLTRARWSDIPLRRGVVIRMDAELSSGLPTVMGVESEIREALTNLVFNGVDAMPQGGTLTLRTRIVNDAPDSAEGGARRICIEVTDTGMGMDDETRRQCLEPFFTTKGERGTGLGLAMVYGMVQRHSAEIEIESTPGKGTTVRTIFTENVAPVAEASGRTGAHSIPSRLRVLVVDDDPMLIKSLRDTLEIDGHVVVTANGGEHGIDAFRAAHRRGEPFAVVITDLGMPHVDGRSVANGVKEVSPTTPVILLTGWGERLLADGGIPRHVDRVLSKPPKLRELREALAHCLVGATP